MQPAEVRRPLAKRSGRRTIGILMLASVIATWCALVLLMRSNNLAGVAMIWLIPASIAVSGIALILITAG